MYLKVADTVDLKNSYHRGKELGLYVMDFVCLFVCFEVMDINQSYCGNPFIIYTKMNSML